MYSAKVPFRDPEISRPLSEIFVSESLGRQNCSKNLTQDNILTDHVVDSIVTPEKIIQSSFLHYYRDTR